MNTRSACTRIFLIIALVLITPHSMADHYVYLNDVDQNSSSARPLNTHGYPRVILSETKAFSGNMERYTKYNIVSGQTGSIKKIAQIQALKPSIIYNWHVSPRAYQNYDANYCQTNGGLAFEVSGPTTQGGPANRGCSIYAGHWLYRAGSTLTQSATSTTNTLKVANASKFQNGKYIVIYDPPVGSFNNAEHAKISSSNTSTNTLTLSSRGYKSVAKSRSAGSIVAQHVIGQSGNSKNWSYNMSLTSPKDGNNKTFAQAMADWFSANMGKDRDGKNVNIRVDGIQFDADFYDELTTKKSDTNNDLITDDGISASGVNWWGLGLENFYQIIRNRFPGKYIVSGNRRARGFNQLSGTQMEAFPAQNRTLPVPTFGDINSQFSRYTFHLHTNKHGPLQTHNLSKTPTRVYPKSSNVSQTSNSIFRLGLGLTLLDDGYYGQENSVQHPDTWYDEYAVNVNKNSSAYGKAIASNPNNESAVRANLGWLGEPLGERKRIYDHTKFSLNRTLLANGTFDSNINGWSGLHVNINRDNSIKKDGNASIVVSAMTSYKVDLNQAKLKGPKVNTVKNKQYTLVFSARASAIREFSASVGGQINKFIVGPNWRRFVYTFTADKTSNVLVSFGVGREKIPMWFDSVYFFEGNANVIRRDFQHGTVVVNATPSSKTVNMGTNFRRISGTQDAINNGANVTNVTIAPWDAAILVRRKGSPVPKPPGKAINLIPIIMLLFDD